MSIESMAIALHHSQAKGATRLVLIGIANHDGDGGAWPSVSTLAKYAAVTPRNVQKHITALVELGEVQRHMQQGGTRMMPDHSRPNLYTFKLTCPPGCDRTKNHKVVDNSPKGVSVATGGVGDDTRGVSVATGGGVSVATPKPYLEPSINSQSSLLSTSPDAFEACWNCGQVKVLDNRGFCPECVYSSKDAVMISCQGCGSARKRQRRGEQHFTCVHCTPGEPSTEAFDHEGANHHAV